MSLTVRDETDADHATVARLVEAAFGQPDEARLVEALRGSVRPLVSLVAEEDGAVRGHVMVSPVKIGDGPEAGGLAPVAVDPEHQGRGLGGRLVRAALERSRALGWPLVVLLGDPAYYARFGFELAAPHGLHYQDHAFDAGFQVFAFDPGALAALEGWVRYPAAFDAL